MTLSRMKNLVVILTGLTLLLGCIQSPTMENEERLECENLNENQCIKTEYCQPIIYRCMAEGCQPVFIRCENKTDSKYQQILNTSKVEKDVFKQFQGNPKVNVIITLEEQGSHDANLANQKEVIEGLDKKDFDYSDKSITGKWFSGVLTKTGLEKAILDGRIRKIHWNFPMGPVPVGEGMPSQLIFDSIEYSSSSSNDLIYNIVIHSNTGSEIDLKQTLIHVLGRNHTYTYSYGGFGVNCRDLKNSTKFIIRSSNQSDLDSPLLSGAAKASVCWLNPINQGVVTVKLIPRIGILTMREIKLDEGAIVK